MQINDNRTRFLYISWRCGSMRAAADELDVAPSSVSRQISVLESELGTELIEHGRRDIRLTEAGERVIEYYREIESIRERLRDDLSDLAGNTTGHVRIGIGEGFLGEALFRSFDDLGEAFPGIAMSVRITDTVEMLRMIGDDDLHFGMAFHPTNEPRIASRFSARVPLCVIMPADHPLARHKQLTLAQLNGQALALLDNRFRMRQLIDLAAIESGAHMNCALETNSIALLIEWVRSGRALTILPQFSVRNDIGAGSMVAVPLSESVLQSLYVHLITRAGRSFSKPTQLLMNSLRKRLGAVAQMEG
ncbi:LysR family transcriptional regulator [Thalassovita mangrovi]|uniref:LysR family transcriptional regulator n=1 Tax=Thalassovita mangrovi TaxID=2692236 RepID=A0A6L8LNG0_9RHOB|nr:LysR family transcriptional regulator [Thalassovita mangrovi]MYM57581.1 LysR family transcriptional regulator [Thalassovita mangrovi]